MSRRDAHRGRGFRFAASVGQDCQGGSSPSVLRIAPESSFTRGVRVRYAPDFGVASLVARGLAPDLTFWFDPRAPHLWRGHRLPLYIDGPEVTVLRESSPEARVELTGSD